MHGGKRKNAGRKSKMELNNFDEFETNLLIAVLNHRYNEDPIDCLPLFLITWSGQLSMSLVELRNMFGPNARARLERWFEIDEGVKGRNSFLRLRSGVGRELYHFLKDKGPEIFNQLRRDMDGVIHSWVDTQEWIIAQQEKLKRGEVD